MDFCIFSDIPNFLATRLTFSSLVILVLLIILVNIIFIIIIIEKWLTKLFLENPYGALVFLFRHGGNITKDVGQVTERSLVRDSLVFYPGHEVAHDKSRFQRTPCPTQGLEDILLVDFP